jgi:crossover junction endodeoxyribonuclease RusA
MYVEFVIIGVPISNQSPGPNLQNWRAAVVAAAQARWNSPLLAINLKAVIINFYLGNRPSLDVDNMSKPILDAMEGVVYDNDRQIIQAEITHVPIGSAFVFVGASRIIVASVQAGSQFVYVRIDDPVDPFPLPR